VCSKASIAAVRRSFPAIASTLRIPVGVLHALPARLRAAQETFDQTGGLHASAWFDPSGKLLALREDVGRHNALDKLIGHRLLDDSADSNGILLVSGRVAFEIVQKALAARFPIIAAISAPTSLAVEFAEENGQTLVGFLREGRMNIYTNPQRITVT
jgi:FdhD protein